MHKYLVMIVCVLCISAGQVIFKSCALSVKCSGSFWTLFFDIKFILTVSLYGITTLLWVWCLQSIPLSRGYLFMSLGFVFVPFLSWWYFNEPITIKYLLGAVLIVSGIITAVI